MLGFTALPFFWGSLLERVGTEENSLLMAIRTSPSGYGYGALRMTLSDGAPYNEQRSRRGQKFIKKI